MNGTQRLHSLMKGSLRFLSPSFLPCWILAFALTRAAQVSLYIPGSVALVLAITGAAVLLASLIMHNRYIAIGFGGILIIAVLVVLFADEGRIARQLLTQFEWFVLYCSGVETLEGGFPLAALCSMGVLISMVIAAFGIRWIFFPGQLAVASGLILMLWLLGHSEILIYTLLAFTALGVNFAISFGQYAQRHQDSGGHQYVIAAWTLPVLALIGALGYLMIIEAGDLPRSNWLGTRLDVVNDYLAQYTGLVKEQENGFSLASVGFSPLGGRLGGPAKPIDSKAFYVRADQSMLLRGAVYDQYSGTQWSKSQTVLQQRLGVSETYAAQCETFNTDMPPAENVPRNFYQSVTLTIYPEYIHTSNLFVPFRIDSAVPVDAMTMLVYFNAYGEVFASRTIPQGTGYTITATLPNYMHGQFGAWVESYQADHAEDCVTDASLLEMYTQLPDDLPANVAALAEEITADASTPYRKAYAIMAYLAENFIYTLEPTVPPADQDFVAYFLETGEGYCTYYASAMAVLGRCVGLPTRYVEGFRIPDSSEKDALRLVSFQDAHAWCEVYLDGIGWIPFDPLSVNLDAESQPALPSEPQPTVDISAFMSQTPFQGDMPETPAESGSRISSWFWLAGAGLLFVVVVTLLIILWERHTRPQRLFRKTPLGQIQRRYADILKLLTYYNAELRPGETPYQYAARIDKWLYLSSGIRMRDLAKILVAISYARHNPTQEDAAVFQKFCQGLRQYTRKNMPFFYLWHYVFRIPYRRPAYS